MRQNIIAVSWWSVHPEMGKLKVQFKGWVGGHIKEKEMTLAATQHSRLIF